MKTRIAPIVLLVASMLAGSLALGLVPAATSPVTPETLRRSSEPDDDSILERRLQNEAQFLNSRHCALCHSNSNRASAMRDSANRPVAPYDLWQASMMANSSRDPFWRAALSAEVAATPSRKATIEEKCTRCHTPMAAPLPASPRGEVLAFLKRNDERASHGMDGVSCTVCHQIADKHLGTEASYSGHFEINRERKIFGPHASPFTMPMQRHVGYTPTHSNHILKSGLCATCHTVTTQSVDALGAPTSTHEFHEQSPYLEWRNSVFNDEVAKPTEAAQSCQGCHMPATDVDGQMIVTRLAHNPGGRDFPFLKPRKPFGRHAFLGANTLLKRILRDHADQLGVIASPEAMNQSIDQTIEFLKTQTADLMIDAVSTDRDTLTMRVTVRNRSGHKLPTAYPSRRVWVELTVTDPQGNTIFASGRCNDRGELIDAQGDVLASERAGGPIVPHLNVIRVPNEVQIYEAVMADHENAPTFTLLRAATYLKDNRLLPRGWASDHADASSTRPYGSGDDADFTGGSDRIVYQIPKPASGELTITARLLFQVISPRYADQLFQYDTPEVKTFQAMFDQAQRLPETLAETTRTFTVE